MFAAGFWRVEQGEAVPGRPAERGGQRGQAGEAWQRDLQTSHLSMEY